MDDIEFRVVNFKGDSCHLTLPSFSTIRIVKEKLSQINAIPIAEQQLLFNRKVLKDNDTLESYGVKI